MRSGFKTIFTIGGIFLMAWLFVRLFLPILFPFLLGTGLALAAEPAVNLFIRKLHFPRALAAGLGVTLAVSGITLLVLLLAAFVVRELGILAGILPNLEDTARSGLTLLEDWLLGMTRHTPQNIQPLLRSGVTGFFSDGSALLGRAAQYLLGLAGAILGHIPDSALSLGTAVISGFMISAKLPRIKRWFLGILPREKLKSVLAALARMKNAVLGWLIAQLKLGTVTFGILFLGFVLLRIPYALLWAGGVSLVDAFPVLGTGTVLLPWALICLLQADTARAIGLLGIYAIVSLTRSVLEPRLLGKHLGLDPLVTLIVLYAGYKVWGIGGMILAPLLAVTALQLVPRREENR